MKKLRICHIVVLAVSSILATGAMLTAQTAPASQPDEAKKPAAVVLHDDGTIDLPAESVPLSKFLSPEGKAYLNQHLHDMANANRGFMTPYSERQKALFAVNLDDTKIAGVHTYVFTPKAGISTANQHRVLINLHGGGFSGCWPGCAELESRPIAALGSIKVVSVDYREAPEYKFPAASEDVASVYAELLKTYKPENIGIFGCSAGGMLTTMAVAWFQKHNLPRPGAIGVFCASAGGFGGDASYTSTPLGEVRLSPDNSSMTVPKTGYFSDADTNDPLVTPIMSSEVLSKFPPTLIITGTRAMEMSTAVHTHAQLVKLGVDADLHVWEGMFHGFFYNPDVPESREAYDVIVKFFAKHLGTK
jgi:acetyl esterase/lipase